MKLGVGVTTRNRYLVPRTEPFMSADDDTVTVYPDAAGGWRWQKQAANGRVIASSGEAFDSEGNAVRAAERANPGYDITIGDNAD